MPTGVPKWGSRFPGENLWYLLVRRLGEVLSSHVFFIRAEKFKFI
jgi:hypothetical protein